MKFLSKRQLLIIGGAILAVLLIGILFVVSIRDDKKTSQRVNLEVWGTEDEDAFEKLARDFSNLNANFSINYTQFAESSFNSRLISALASGRGPDIFFVKSHSLPIDLISAAPEIQFSLEEVRSLFPRVIEQDFAPGGEVYALPLGLDTLALIYNQKMFDRAGVVDPPKTWDEFEDLVSDLRVLDEDGRVKKAGAAFGGSDRSIPNGTEILQLLMMQNGAQMTDESAKSAKFASGNTKGVAALNFYAKFADSTDTFFTWDDSGRNAMDSFASEETVILITYKSKMEELEAKNPFLEMGVGPMPQTNPENPVNFADYYGLAVSKQSRKQASAWEFIIQATTNRDLAGEYSKSTKNPPALKSLISENLKSAEYGIFARQALVARSWFYYGHEEIKEALSQAIQKRISGAADASTALRQAETQISRIMSEASSQDE